MSTLGRLRGIQDASQESWLRKRDLQDRLAELLGSYGYRFLDTPVLEPTDLFLRKSGGELASRMYSFTDPGGNQVSLRPEFTSPIMRHYLEHAGEVSLPVRWQYAGPVFRYEPDSHGEGKSPQSPSGQGGSGGICGQFTQIGAELLGSGSVLADAELLGLAALVPSYLGLQGCRVELADLGVLHSVLAATGVSERARAFIIGSVPALRAGQSAVPAVLERARQLHLTANGTEEDPLGRAIAGLDDAQARKVILGLLQWTSADQLGQRDPDEVVDRLLRKLRGTDDEGELRRGLELISRLAAIRGEPLEALAAARTVVQEAGADPTAPDRLHQLVDLLQEEPGLSGCLSLDFGLVRGLAYYSGIIFEVRHPSWPTSLGGGGRYDGLARALGSPEQVPALGFAYTLETLLALSGSPPAGADSGRQPPAALVLAEGPGGYQNALRVAGELRQQGYLAELDVCGLDLSGALSRAETRGIAQVVVAHQDGRVSTHGVQ